ncbi:S-type pyocin domain-containing protein [Providencia sp. Me31A]|uniref:S-type pyocin domain-containing protein n=1 Tax=Providencia sp. Me31A TaxID=3392637 RepID=UPI003D2C5A59
MSQKVESCIICENYRFWLELQLVDDKGQPLANVPYTLAERGTGRTMQGSSDSQGLIKAEGLTARPYTLSLEAQPLADALTAMSPPAAIQGKEKTLNDYCREQGDLLSENNRAGAFNSDIPSAVYRMTAGQINRSVHYQQRDNGYLLFFPYDHRRVIAIKRIAEPVFAKSVLRGEGNTDAGEHPEISNYFGSTAVYQMQLRPIQSKQAKPSEFSIASLFGISTAEANPFILIPLATMFLQQMAVSGGAVQSQNTWQSSDEFYDDDSTSRASPSIKMNVSPTLSALSILMSMGYAGVFTRTESSDSSDLLTYEDLKEKALAKGTATTRIRMSIDDGGQVVGYHTSTDSGQDQVPVRMMDLASEAETQKVRSLAAYQASEGLRYAGSTAEVYKFITDDGEDVFISYAKNGNFLGVQSQIHEGERQFHTGHPPSPPFDIRPHTGGNQLPEPVDITSAGGFPINEEQPQIYITPVPDAKDLRDYILITPTPSIPAIYVYMQVKGKRTKNRLPEGKNGDLGPSDDILEKRNPETNELIQVRKYDSEGKPVKDIDYGHDHGAGDPHVHEWKYPSNSAPNKVRLAGRPLQPGETIND